MQTMNNIYKYMALLAFTAALCVGCQQEADEWIPATGTKSVMMELSVSTAELTRAIPTDAEKTINTLRVYAFSGDRQAGYIYREATATGTPFYMDLELPENGSHSVDFYLVANEKEMVNATALTENMTKNQLKGIIFEGLNTCSVLPMYANTTITINVDDVRNTANAVEGHEGHFVLTQTVAFELTRPIAKLSVYAAKVAGAENDPQISKVELLAGGTRLYNYLYPQDEATLAAISSRANNRVMLSTTMAIDKEITKGTADVENPSNYNEVVVGQYLAEVPYGATAWDTPSAYDNAAVLHVEYAGGAGQLVKNAYIYLPKVQRNHHIKVCILINAEGQIIVNYTVAPWDDHAMPDYRFEYPTHSYLRESIPTTDAEAAAKPSAPATMKENQPFVAYFQMTRPDGDKWTPTLLGLNASNCDVWVYDDTNTQITSFPIPASDKWYRIEVLSKSGMPINGEVNLAISYTATSFTQSEFLLINGSNHEHYWPYSGASEQNAEYVTITMVN